MTQNYQRHTTHTDALDTLGTVLTQKEGRDAIHLAVECVQAAHLLRAGEHVRFDEDGKAVRTTPERGVGIVDPFINTLVGENEWFWLVVYPRQITSLRHVWEHPAFPPSGESVALAEAWIREYCADKSGYYHDDGSFFDALVAGFANWDGDNYIHIGGYDIYGSISDELIDQMSIYLGRDFSKLKDGNVYFSCSC